MRRRILPILSMAAVVAVMASSLPAGAKAAAAEEACDPAEFTDEAGFLASKATLASWSSAGGSPARLETVTWRDWACEVQGRYFKATLSKVDKANPYVGGEPDAPYRLKVVWPQKPYREMLAWLARDGDAWRVQTVRFYDDNHPVDAIHSGALLHALARKPQVDPAMGFLFGLTGGAAIGDIEEAVAKPVGNDTDMVFFAGALMRYFYQ